jgi:hypothetical protein
MAAQRAPGASMLLVGVSAGEFADKVAEMVFGEVT